MPLRDDLLEPIAGDNSSGANLYYDKIFDQIKEARTEDDDSGSAGAWERVVKKADHALVIKLAGEALAKRSKDLRLASWLIESHTKREGLPILSACLELLWKLQDTFWDTLYPEIDEDGDLGLRVSAVEGLVHRLAAVVRRLPVTKAGYSASQYTESRLVGYEEAADTEQKQLARTDALEQGQISPEDFDTAAAATPKASFAAFEAGLGESLRLLEELGVFHEEKYGDDYPALNKLTTSIEEVKQVVSALLYERRKTDPDPIEYTESEAADTDERIYDPFADSSQDSSEEASDFDANESPEELPVRSSAPTRKSANTPAFSGKVNSPEQAYAAVLQSALFLHGNAPESPVPYLLCAGLRLGETRAQGGNLPFEFAAAPATETRQALRRHVHEYQWAELFELGLRTLAEPCGRVWLDLQRYLHRAASELGYDAQVGAILSTTRALLQDFPDLRSATLDDDTPAANAETQQWLDAEVVKPAEATHDDASSMPDPVFESEPTSSAETDGNSAPDLYQQATALLERGRAGEAIKMLVRDAELQPSGRTRFQRRVQVAQLCLAADQSAVAYPVLVELSREIERRGLESWETGEMLAHPLSLLLRCLERRESSTEDKESIFERLCRLDPQAAMGLLQ